MSRFGARSEKPNYWQWAAMRPLYLRSWWHQRCAASDISAEHPTQKVGRPTSSGLRRPVITANGLPNPAEVWSKPDVRSPSTQSGLCEPRTVSVAIHARKESPA
jgi:hypothetical protein